MRVYLLILSVIFLVSCDNDDTTTEIVTVATPTLMSKAEFRESVDILPPQTIKQSGKIYAYGDYIFVNDVNAGVHIIDNKDPKNPNSISYIKIPGNEDISIKSNFLYADSATDLLVFDISNINKVTLKSRLQDVFSVYDFQLPENADIMNWNNIDYENNIIVGWTLTQERRERPDPNEMIDFAADAINTTANSASRNVGQGGSLARFQIVDSYLYTVSSHDMAIFDINNLKQPKEAGSFYAGNNIETLFEAEGYLYIGSTDGMYIYNIENPIEPAFESEFIHWTGCDPVVVQGDYAYLTLRGGNNCGQQDSVLEIINIKDKKKPELVERYLLENPYGLGIKGDKLFVCDGNSGLKVYSLQTPTKITLKQEFKNIQATDVIPLNDKLLMIGDQILFQYAYTESGIELLSSFSLK